MAQTQTTLAALKSPPVPAAATEIVRAGFDTADGFALMQRGASLLANSTIVPSQYRAVLEKKDKWGKVKERLENPSAISNCVVALNMSQRMGADPLMIMQNLYIVEGRPAWSAQYIIASINACGKYSPLRFKMEDLGKKEVEYTETSWQDNERISTIKKTTIHDIKCVAWALEKKTGEVLESPPVTIELAVKEGWYGKNGSKWQTMPEVMLRYRAASFFGKLYAPELLMGIQTAEEVQDSTYDMEMASGGSYQVTTDEIRRHESPSQKFLPEEQEAEKPTHVTKKRGAATDTKNTATSASTGKASPVAQTASSAAEAAPTGKRPSHEPSEIDTGEDPFGGGYEVTCPNSKKSVQEIDCASKPCRDGCPAFEM